MTKPFSFLISNFLFLILLCAAAIIPLLRANSPCTHDGALHYFRVTAMRHALQDGILFTRYLPDLAFGYGYPFFNYRAALSYYLTLALYLTGLALPAALNGVYVLSIVGSAITAYLLARDLFGPRAGVVAAIAYAYAPYQFLDALLRGNAPEAVALPLFPLILWAFRRLALTGHRRWFLVSVGSLAALLLTHNISSLLFVPFLAAYLAMLWLVYHRVGQVGNLSYGNLSYVGGAFALALGLTAFFWGPALLEREYVQLHMSHVTRNNDFHYNFLSLAEVLAPPAAVDTSLMNPPMRIHLGLAQAILGGIGLVVGLIPSTALRQSSGQGSGHSRWRDRERRATLIFFALTAAVMVWMSTRASLWLWEHVPLLPFVQFPWRLIGRAALPVALLASAPIRHPPFSILHSPFSIPHSLFFILYSSFFILYSSFFILLAFPSTYPPRGYCPSAPYPTINDVFAYEHRSKLVGVDPEGSYFPAWVKQRPDGSPLEEQYAAGGPITRFDETALPDGEWRMENGAATSVGEAEYGPNRARLVVETPDPFRACYLAFYFPGWRVTIDGEPVPIAPTEPDGLISFDVPAGRHTIVVRFGETPLRLVADAISFFSLLLLAILVVRSPRSKARRSLSPRPLVSLSPCLLVSLSLIVVFKLAVVDRTDTIFRRPTLQPDGTLPGVEHVLNQPYADGLTLIGYDLEKDLPPASGGPGGVLRLDLYWTAHAQPTARYQTVVHLVGPNGLRWSRPDTFRPRGYADYPPTTTWSPGRYALDSHEIEPLPGTPLGVYDVVLTVFDRDTLAPLSVLNEQGQPAAPDLTLGQVTLTAPRHPASLDELGIRQRLDVPLGPLTLLGADFDRDEAAPGDPVLLTTFWRADEQPTGELTFHLALVAPDGFIAAEYKETRFFPKNLVSTGDTWRGQHLLHLPAHLDTGDHTWTIQLAQSPSHPITQLLITAPDRTFTPPPVDIEINTRLGNVATLIGVTQSPSHQITLVWRAEAETHISYHVFLHLLDQEGRLIAQSDGVPANWTRPTTGWLPGEYITDVHVLTIPPDALAGDYTLYAGLYVPGGERLTAPDSAGAVPLTTITVEAP